MYRPTYITEPDFFNHEKPERLICDRIEIEGYGNQKTVLNVPVVRLRPFKLYELVIRQPIPSDARGLPLRIKAIADTDFVPNISVGYGRSDECHKGYGDGYGGCDGIQDGGEIHGDVEVITERKEARMFDVTMFGYNNAAFANDLVFRNEEPYPFVKLYLNDRNEFVMLPPCAPRRECRPKKLIKRTEVVVREPIHAESIGINRAFKEFVHPRNFETNEVWVEGSCGHGHHGGYRGW